MGCLVLSHAADGKLGHDDDGVASIVSSLSFTSVGVFEFVWVVGMIAMMFPAMIPVVLFYDRIVTKSESNQRAARMVGTPFFLSGYLSMYAALGLVAYVGVFFAISLASATPSIAPLSVIGPSLVLIVAGLYQLTPLKTRCLSNCISPLGFFALHFRRDLSGALEMGVTHESYCVGCCWAYMLVILAVAAMSIPFMAVLAAVIALEKVIIRGVAWFTRVIAGVFLVLGIGSFFFPDILSLLSNSL